MLYSTFKCSEVQVQTKMLKGPHPHEHIYLNCSTTSREWRLPRRRRVVAMNRVQCLQRPTVAGRPPTPSGPLAMARPRQAQAHAFVCCLPFFMEPFAFGPLQTKTVRTNHATAQCCQAADPRRAISALGPGRRTPPRLLLLLPLPFGPAHELCSGRRGSRSGPAGRLEAHLLTATHQLGSKTISEKLKGELQAASLLQGIMSASNFLGNKTTTSDDTEVGLQGVPCHYALNRLKIR